MRKVKICGLSRAEDIAAVNRALPDFVGFVFAPSRRRVDIQTAAALKKKLDSRIEVVGVFVNENVETVIRAYNNRIIDLVQLHGDEDDDYVKRLKESCGCRVIKAIGVGDTLPVLPSEPDYLLFDALQAGSKQRGGIGKTFDWSLLTGYRGPPYFLAGGLTVDNVSDAITFLSPYCVDVSSGVETNGVKDAGKIHEFVCQVRGEIFS
jgi:phosphoribosylanthranilate isomerase